MEIRVRTAYSTSRSRNYPVTLSISCDTNRVAYHRPILLDLGTHQYPRS